MMVAALAVSLWAFWQLLALPSRRARLRRDGGAVDPVDPPDAARRHRRRFPGAVGLPARSAVRDDDPHRHRHRHADSHLLDRVHPRRAAGRGGPVLLLPEPVLLLHAHARPGEQLPGDVRGLGGRGALFVPADRLLVREEERVGRGQEGVHHEPHRRLGLHPRHLPGLLHVRHARLPRGAERGRDDADRERSSASCRRSACCSSSAPPARARRFPSTSGCRTRWRARRRCRP